MVPAVVMHGPVTRRALAVSDEVTAETAAWGRNVGDGAQTRSILAGIR